MQRVLSFPTSRTCSDSSEFVTKRLCCSFMFTIGFVSLVAGFLLGRFAFDKELEISRSKLRRVYQSIYTHNKDMNASYLSSQFNGSRIQEYISKIESLKEFSESKSLKEAELLIDFFKRNGFDFVSNIEESRILLSFPDSSKLNKVSIINGTGQETVRYNDSRLLSWLPDPTDGVSVPKVVDGGPVYVNYGRDEDYHYLDSLGVNVNGRVFIVRVGKLHTVDIVTKALEHDAKGVVLYHDPQQTDITLPLISSTQLAKLQSIHGDDTINPVDVENDYKGSGCVPVAVITSDDAEHIFRVMSASNPSPDSWRGKLRSLYPIGPGFADNTSFLRLSLNTVNILKSFYNVMATMTGVREADRLVVLSSDRSTLRQRDSLSTDTAVLMELAGVFGQLKLNQGWRPYRSLMLVSWGLEGYDQQLQTYSNEKWGLFETSSAAYVRIGTSIRNGTFKGTPALYSSIQSAINSVIKDSNSNFSNILEFGDKNDIIDNGIPFLQTTGHELAKATDINDLQMTTAMWGILSWNMTTSRQLPFNCNSYADFLTHSITVVNNHLGSIAKKHALFLDSLTDEISQFIATLKVFNNNWQTSLDDLETKTLNDQVLKMIKTFMVCPVGERSDSSRHVIFSRGVSSLDSESGFGILQDLLREITSVHAPDDLHQRIVTHLTTLVECVVDIRRTMLDPVQLIVNR